MSLSHPSRILKFCPKCGSEHFLFNGDRCFLCQNCNFSLYINSASAVAAIIVNDQQEILLTIRAFEPAKGKLDLPGGFVDPMESAEAAVIREIKEELNLQVTKLTYLTSYPNDYVFNNYSVFTTDLAFVCHVNDLSKIEANDDVCGFKFLHPNKIDHNDISSKSISYILEYYKSHLNKTK